jgi:hypothetical protein
MADTDFATMTDEEFAAHWRERSDVVGKLPAREAKIQLLSLQVDWFEGVGDQMAAYKIKPEYRNSERIRMLREFTKRVHHKLFGPSNA